MQPCRCRSVKFNSVQLVIQTILYSVYFLSLVWNFEREKLINAKTTIQHEAWLCIFVLHVLWYVSSDMLFQSRIFTHPVVYFSTLEWNSSLASRAVLGVGQSPQGRFSGEPVPQISETWRDTDVYIVFLFSVLMNASGGASPSPLKNCLPQLHANKKGTWTFRIAPQNIQIRHFEILNN